VPAHIERAQLQHQVLGGVALVGPECHPPRPVATPRDQVERGQPFGIARSGISGGIDGRPIAG
jgi:hypothetical protein